MMHAAGAEGLKLLHVDPALIVVEKPAGLLAVPGRGEAGLDNLAQQVQRAYGDALVVHRLDMSTSGLMLFARGPEAQRRLSTAFAERRVHKRYVAVVEGRLAREAGEIDAALAADWPNRPRQIVHPTRGRAALTRWRLLEHLDDASRLELEPVTGRSHQLRVHLQSIGHPIRGDALYAPQPLRAGRLLLHASALELVHPQSGLPLRFSSPVPF
jgi:tRNA pseudouridine32 synthase/23S rRNA pseudouridine746 synthase